MGKKEIKFSLDITRSNNKEMITNEMITNKLDMSKKIIYGFLIKKAFEMMDKKK